MQWYSSRFQCSKRSLLKISIDHKSWQIPGALPFSPCFIKGVFACIFHGNLLCHCKYNGRHFITINVLMAVGKLKLCQYRFIMVTRRAQDQVKETLKQPYQTTVSIECLPCLCIDAASYHEVCQKNATT